MERDALALLWSAIAACLSMGPPWWRGSFRQTGGNPAVLLEPQLHLGFIIVIRGPPQLVAEIRSPPFCR